MLTGASSHWLNDLFSMAPFSSIFLWDRPILDRVLPLVVLSMDFFVLLIFGLWIYSCDRC
jgi:hypothetical protein